MTIRGRIWGFDMKKGFTIIEEAVVIAIIALIAIPVATLLRQSVEVQKYGSDFVKGQYYANLIMQDFERRVRQASSGSITIATGNPYRVTFTYQETDKNGRNPSSVTYNYEIDDPNTPNSLFYRWTDGNSKEVFPPGLTKGIIKNFEITDKKVDTTQDPPYYITVKMETSEGTILQKTIYLVNYYKQQ